MKSKYKVSIIIPTYNRKLILKETISSLKQQNFNRNNYEVIICDDGSSDNTEEMVNEFEGKMNIKYFYQQDKGFRAAKARNIGIINAEGEICIFIDSGIIVSPNFIEEHVKLHTSYKDVVIGRVLGFDQYCNSKDIILKKYDSENITKSIEDLQKEKVEDIRDRLIRLLGEDLGKWEAPWVIFWSVNVSVSKRFLIECGMFDEWFNTWGGEDTDLGVNLYINNGSFKLNKNALAIDYPHKKENKFDTDIVYASKELWRKTSYIHSKYNLVSTLVYKYMDMMEIDSFLKEYKEFIGMEGYNGKLL